jgi:uncharacterized membrane protein (DUF4010 family)
MANLELAALDAGDNCAFYKAQRDYEAGMLQGVNKVIFAIVVVVGASLIGLIISIAIKEWGLTAATAIGSVVSGTAMKFILAQRKHHQDRIDLWVKAITDAGCPA